MKNISMFLFIAVHFILETLGETIAIAMVFSLTDDYRSFDFHYLLSFFFDTAKIVLTIKLVFFLPIYLLFYYIKGNLKGLVKNHLILHSCGIFIFSIIFWYVAFTKAGFAMILLSTFVSFLVAILAKTLACRFSLLHD